MAPPDASTYQAEAQSIYAPQQAADQATAQATEQNTIATLEAEKPQIATDYTSAIDKLTQSVTDQTGKISQLYAQNLGGNFSGLQANSMSAMYASADQQQSIIEQTEANKLAQITTSEGEATTTYNADLSSIASKYQGEEASYASGAFNTATNQYNTQQNELLRSEISASAKVSSAAAKAPSLADNASALNQTLTANSGSDKYVSPQELSKAFNAWTAAGESAEDFFNYASQFINPNNDNYKYYLPGSTTQYLPSSNG